MHTKYPLIKFRTLLFTALITALMFAEATSFHLTTRKGLLSFELHSNQQQYDSQAVEDMERKMAWAKHTVMTVAASIMGVPTDVFTTPPMVDPKPPSTPSERLLREKINNLLSKGYPNPLDGFEIPDDQVQLINKINNSNSSGHNPSTYGEVTPLGARQLFHYMKMFEKKDTNSIHFIDLGSGNGKLLVQAYLEIPNLFLVEGIELAIARHSLAIQSWNEIKDEARSIRSQTKEILGMKQHHTHGDTELNLVQGDLFQMDISTATHIYVASLCFTDDMMDALSRKISEEGDNLSCVATLKPFNVEFERISGFKQDARYVEMTWTRPRGIGGIVYFYSKCQK